MYRYIFKFSFYGDLKNRPLNAGDCLIQVAFKTDLTVHYKERK